MTMWSRSQSTGKGASHSHQIDTHNRSNDDDCRNETAL